MSIENPSVLVVSAHAADFVWRAGGTIAKYTRAGSDVHIVCVSQGQRGESINLWNAGATSEADVIAIRRQESEDAAKALGASVSYLNATDHPLLYDQALVETLTAEFRRTKPQIVLTHFETDKHNPDHEAVHQLTRWAARAATVNGVLPNLPMLTYIPQIFSFESDQPTLDRFTPDIYIDISDVINDKLQAMACVKSQFDDMCDRYMDRARFRASMMKNTHCEFAEAFVRQYPYEGNHLPI